MGYSLKAVVQTGADAAAGTGSAKKSAQTPACAQRKRLGSGPVSTEPSVSLGRLARFYRQLATSVKAGIPLFQALSDLQSVTSDRKLQHSCREMRSHVQSGGSLSGAMAAYPHLFPAHTVGLNWGGELGGYLDAALEEAAAELEEEAKEHRYARVGWWLANINIASFIASVPAFQLGAAMSAGLGAAAEGSAAVLRAMFSVYFQAFLKQSVPLLVVWLVLMIAWKRWKRTPSVRRTLDALILRVPAWGRLHRERSIARFLRSLNRLYASAVAPAQAWAAASTSVRNSEMAQALRGCEELIRRPGGTLQQAFQQSGIFALDDVGMVATGERAGSVPETLEQLASYHSDAAENARRTARAVSIQALILSFIIAGGVVVVAVEKGHGDFYLNLMKQLGV